MTVFQIGIIFLILSLASIGQNDAKARKRATIIICIIMILQMGLRDIAHSGDTWNYEIGYHNIQNLSFETLFNSFRFVAEDYNERDPGYKIFVKITQLIIGDFRAYLFIVAAIISIPLCKLMYHFIPSVSGLYFSGLIYESLFASFFMTGMRQTIAMGIIYASVPLLLNKNISSVKALTGHYAMLLLAYTIHTSALVFAPAAILMKVKNPRKLLILAILLIPALMAYASQIVAYFGEGTIFEKYAIGSEDNLGTPVFSAMVFLITIVITSYSKLFIKAYPQSHRLLLVTLFMACCLVPSSWVDSNFIRVVFTYLIFIMALIPMLIDCISTKKVIFNRTQLYATTGCFLLILMYNSN